MSSLDRASDKVIRKVRNVHQATARQEEVIAAQRQEEVARQAEEPDELDMDDPEQLQAEEQRLIVAIAQHPKEVDLYSQIARVYMRLHNYADAIEALKQATKLEPANDQFLKRLERARRKQTEMVAPAPK